MSEDSLKKVKQGSLNIGKGSHHKRKDCSPYVSMLTKNNWTIKLRSPTTGYSSYLDWK